MAEVAERLAVPAGSKCAPRVEQESAGMVAPAPFQPRRLEGEAKLFEDPEDCPMTGQLRQTGGHRGNCPSPDQVRQ
jgi:hypothetical protein